MTKQNKPFTAIPNEVVSDNSLSLKAKGLYSIIKHYITIDSWTIRKNHIKKQCKEKDTAFNSAWNELKEEGYLIQKRLKDTKGKFIYQYELTEGKAHTHKTHDMEKPQHGKDGGYSKTYQTKNGLNNNVNLLYGSFEPENKEILKKFKNEDQEILEVVEYYLFTKYPEEKGKPHPVVKEDQMETVIRTLESLYIETDINFSEEGQSLVDQHFKTNYSKGTDWKIQHFATEGILGNRFIELFSGDHPFKSKYEIYGD